MPTVSFDCVTPVFTVDDLSSALEFYEHKLGFSVAWTWGTPPDRASVRRGNVEITLSTRGLVDEHGPSRVFIQLTDIDDYFNSVVASGAKIDVPIGDREYGMRDFHLIDPSGNHLSFGQMIAIGA
jgi:predicted enzyme related to lactoylglutathione lyase